MGDEAVLRELLLDIAEVPPDIRICHGARYAEEHKHGEADDKQRGKAEQAVGPRGCWCRGHTGSASVGHDFCNGGNRSSAVDSIAI